MSVWRSRTSAVAWVPFAGTTNLDIVAFPQDSLRLRGDDKENDKQGT
jgi:hypothetical protein